MNSTRDLILLVVVAVLLVAQTLPGKPRYITYSEAQPILQTLDEILPAELKGKAPEARAAAWQNWVRDRDAAVRARLRRGDEDTLANFLLFGTSFTKQPRVTLGDLAR